MSYVDPVIISAMIGLAGVVSAYILSKRADREMERFKIKKEIYENLVKQLSTQIHLVQTMGGKSSDEVKEKMDAIINTLWLYGSDEVMLYLNAFLSGEGVKQNTDYLGKLLWAMRKDLIPTKLKESEVKWYRAI